MAQQQQTITLDARRELCQARVTLNGHAAKISGARNDFATVTEMSTGLSAEWAWATVARIVASGGGAFTTVEPAKITTGPYPGMRPSKDASRPSCLVVNPQNARASEDRRARLLAAFDTLDCNERADLLELFERIADNAGEHLEERREARTTFHRIYAAAGLE